MAEHAHDLGPAPAQPRTSAGILVVLSQFGMMQVVLAATGVIRNKVIALKLGPAAFGEYSQIASMMSVVYTVVSFGMMVSLSRNAAKAGSDPERRAQLANANGMILALSLVTGLGALALLGTGRLLPIAGLAQGTVTVAATALFIAAIPFEGLKNNYLALLQGILDVRGLAARRAIGVLVVTVVAVPLVWVFGFIGAAAQYFLLSALVTVLLGARCRQLGYPPLGAGLDRRIVWSLASFGAVSLGSSFAQVTADTAVRASLIEVAGAAANGLLQAPFVLSQTVKMVVLSSISSVSLATIAPKEDGREISSAIDKLLEVVIPAGASAIGLLGLFGALALTILYSNAFAPAAALFPYILVADTLLVFIWVIGTPLLARGDRILWLVLDLVWAAVRWGVALVLIRRQMGALAVVIGYLAAIGLHLGLNLVVFRRFYRLDLRPVHLARLAFGVALVAALSVVGRSSPISIPVTAGAFAVWAGYTLYYARRTGMLAALRRRLGRS